MSQNVENAIRELLHERDYPCVPALLSLQQHQYIVGEYSAFGEGRAAEALHRDLMHFRAEQKKTGALYMSFWAVYMDTTGPELDESEYERRMWAELSAVARQEPPDTPWDPAFSPDPRRRNFTLSLAGDAFFVVGLHARSSRRARRFPWPAMVFNLYDQFEELDRRGRYQATVRTNRAREMRYAGSLNPMVEKHGDRWEAIQFSGKENPPDWKCPFHRP